jgi:hypothetical protein
MEGKERDSSNGGDYSQEHDRDEPGGSIGCFGGGLSDSKGVYEDICEIEEWFHDFWKGASSVLGAHLLFSGSFSAY